MQDALNERLRTLRAERDKGVAALAELESRQTQLRETLLRIAGAIQVLEELLAAQGAPDEADRPAGP